MGDHANHPKYDEQIELAIDRIYIDSNGNMDEAFEDLVDFVDGLKLNLISDIVKGDFVVNSIKF